MCTLKETRQTSQRGKLLLDVAGRDTRSEGGPVDGLAECDFLVHDHISCLESGEGVHLGDFSRQAPICAPEEK